MEKQSQRRMERVTLLQPVAAQACGERAFVVDASVSGVRLSHSTLFSERKPCPVSFEWQGIPIEFTAQLRWTKLQRGKSVYQSGFEIQRIDAGSNAALHTLIEACVERALDEQKANAQGIPPLAPSSTQISKTNEYVRHELVHGVWRKSTTTDPRQPTSGFTVRSAESIHQVDLLRAAYSAADPSMREMIRKLAELSITHPDGLPARRYTP
jgi:PilZ domain-containing protein